MKVELVFVAQDKTIVHIVLDLQQGATVSEALLRSNIYAIHPETQGMRIGIYARQVTLETMLRDGDRIEIYRPLNSDPKETRRLKAKQKGRR